MSASMQIEIICTGDEVLTGKIVNSNFSYISQKLEDFGLSVRWGTTVGDDRETLLAAFRQAGGRAGSSCWRGRPCDGSLSSGRTFGGLRQRRGTLASDSCSNRRRRCGRECLSASRCAIGLEEIRNNIDGFFISERARIGDGHRIPDAIE